MFFDKSISIMPRLRTLETWWMTCRSCAFKMSSLNTSLDKRYRNWPQIKSDCLARVKATTSLPAMAAKSFSLDRVLHLTQEMMTMSFSVP